MSRILRSTVYDMKSTEELLSIEMKADNENNLPINSMKLGEAAVDELQQLLSKKLISEKDVFSFKVQFKEFVIAVITKLQKKSPISKSLVIDISCLSPKNLVADQVLTANKFSKIVTHFKECGWIKTEECDAVNEQFRTFTEKIRTDPLEVATATNFIPGDNRLDSYFYEHLSQTPDLSLLWNFIKMVLILSHGQATVEQGFSTNKETEDVNLAEQSLIARRSIIDHIRRVGGVKNVAVTPQALIAAASARRRYSEWLESEKKRKENENIVKQKRKNQEELDSLVTKKRRLEMEVKNIGESVDDLCNKALESKTPKSIIVKLKAMHDASKHRSEELDNIKKSIKMHMRNANDF